MYRGRIFSVSVGALSMCAMLGLVFATTVNAKVAEKPAARATAYAEVQENISANVSVKGLTSSAPSRTAMGDPPACEALPWTDCDGQIGIQGFDEQQCNDGQWTGTAYPIQTGLAEGETVDTLTFTVNTNRAGGDLYLMLDTDEAGGDPCGSCPMDVNDDQNIGPLDLATLLGAWGPTDPDNCQDVNGDENIGPLDLATLLGAWGPCAPGPDIGCQPDTTNILASLCCAVSGMETGVENIIHFQPVAVPASGKIWVVFTGRSGQAGLGDPNDPNSFDGDNFPGHQVARECEDDGAGNCTAESTANNAFANLVGTGNAGDWTDLHDLGDPLLGTPYCVELSSTGGKAGVFDCIENPDPVGACCFVDDESCLEMEGWRCGLEGGLPGPNPAIYLGDGVGCGECAFGPDACNPEAGDCCNPDGNGTPGCDNNTCCISVCTSDPFCCDGEWEIGCAGIANDQSNSFGCATGFGVCAETLCAPMIIATGNNDSIGGFLSVELDRMGSWAHPTFGGGTGDQFNPAGPEGLDEPMFGSAIQLHSGELKEVLSCNDTIRGVNTDDIDAQDPAAANGGLVIESPTECELPCTSPDLLVASDVSGNGVDDTLEGAFTVSGSGLDLFFETFQQVMTVGGDGSGVSTLTQTYTITNNGVEEVSFSLVRLHDLDLLWVTDDFIDDVVGTSTNGAGCGGNYVFQMEEDHPETAITLSSTSPGAYSGAKGGLDPDDGVCMDGTCVGGSDAGAMCFADINCTGDAVPWAFGTDVQEWEGGGMPAGWGNKSAHVPDEDEQFNINGDSGPTPEPDNCTPCDGKIILSVDVTIAVGGTEVVTFVNTYGQPVPAGCE